MHPLLVALSLVFQGRLVYLKNLEILKINNQNFAY